MDLPRERRPPRTHAPGATAERGQSDYITLPKLGIIRNVEQYDRACTSVKSISRVLNLVIHVMPDLRCSADPDLPTMDSTKFRALPRRAAATALLVRPIAT